MFSLMGNCIEACQRKKKPKRELTLAILGIDNAGKTVTCKGLQGEQEECVAPTVGFSSVEFHFDKTDITLFDLGGGKKIRDIWSKYLAEIYGIIYVVDSSDLDRIDEARVVLMSLLENKHVTGKPLLLLANKQDVPGAMDEIDVCEHLNLEEIVNINKVPCRVETCSAIIGYGKKLDKPIREGMSWLISTIKGMYEELHDRVEADKALEKEKTAKLRAERNERVRKIREDREKEKQRRRDAGEEVTDEEEDDHDLGPGVDPFKRVNVQELEAKSQKLKEAKKKKKEAQKGRQELEKINDAYSDNEVAVPIRSSRKKKKKYSTDSEEENDDPMRSTHSWKSHFSKKSEDQDELVESKPKQTFHTPRSARRDSPSPPRLRSEMTPLGKLNGHRTPNGGSSDDEVLRNRSPWIKRKSPRPGSPNLPPPISSHLSSHLPGLDGADELDVPVSNRRGLMPLSNLEPLDSYDDGSKKKRKKKKKPRRNQTVPSDDEMLDHDDSQPHSRNWGNTPPSTGRNMRASRSPGLEPLQEPDNEMDSFSTKWGLAEELPSLSTRTGPNMDYDDDIIT